ncbi:MULTISPECIES: M20/M25/M40 family metallo-hydrolase [unclassified Chryseobacterium]|uniref:M20/M25/M40 family metallo-hydrolase n=1 Tax=unclassified Chryseobacterium TaxID=2593645 RepID=UPI00100B87F2|nr:MULTISPECIES: M20/M25/M40 family metallo-hydrolase [unclassified Chryseobacterium]RXM51389.1 leucyl aminopeptidase [Chryseobacterium sp. CH25]RXM65000.1 leucyl aminopeptidase [Chryseobacterium sp. CH1]
MKKITVFLLTSLALQNIGAQNLIQAYKNRADMVSQTNITTHLTDFENLGIKTTGSPVNTNTLNWLKNKYTSYGYTASQIVEDPFSFGSTSSKNLVITKTGTVYPDKYVIICGHYDTIYGPGVSDNGSGTAILLEAARILKDVPTEYSIKFIHFSGEEQGLKGSYHYADYIAYQGNTRKLDIKLVLNIDQVGGLLGNNNNTIVCEKDISGMSGNNAASATATQELAVCTGLYSPLQTFISNAYSSDYIPFEEKGYTITGFYEYIRSQNEHSPNDTFANIDPVYVFNVGKAAVGALQHFAVATTSNNILGTQETTGQKLSEAVNIYPNPAKNLLTVEFPKKPQHFNIEISDMTGNIVLRAENEHKINTTQLINGVYMVSIKTDRNQTVKKIIIDK